MCSEKDAGRLGIDWGIEKGMLLGERGSDGKLGYERSRTCKIVEVLLETRSRDLKALMLYCNTYVLPTQCSVCLVACMMLNS